MGGVSDCGSNCRDRWMLLVAIRSGRWKVLLICLYLRWRGKFADNCWYRLTPTLLIFSMRLFCFIVWIWTSGTMNSLVTGFALLKPRAWFIWRYHAQRIYWQVVTYRFAIYKRSGHRSSSPWVYYHLKLPHFGPTSHGRGRSWY